MNAIKLSIYVYKYFPFKLTHLNQRILLAANIYHVEIMVELPIIYQKRETEFSRGHLLLVLLRAHECLNGVCRLCDTTTIINRLIARVLLPATDPMTKIL